MSDKVDKTIEKISTLWEDKYQPRSISEVAATDEITKFFNKCIESKDIFNVLLYGRPGVGKNSLVNILLNEIPCASHVINGSERRGIDTVRDEVIQFSETGSWGDKLKVIVINEADGITREAQDSLREVIEKNPLHVRFIFTCNSITKIHDAIRSRTMQFEINPPLKAVAKRMATILKQENIKFDIEILKQLVKESNKDIRQLIKRTQALTVAYGELTDPEILSTNNKKMNEFFDIILKLTDVKSIAAHMKTVVLDDNVYSLLKTYILERGGPVEALMIVADHAYKSKFIWDQDLIFLSCIFSLQAIMR